MTQNFKQKAIVSGVSAALAMVGGAAIAASTNSNPTSPASNWSSKNAVAFVPDTVRIAEAANSLATNGFITLTVGGAKLQGVSEITTSLAAFTDKVDNNKNSYANIVLTSTISAGGVTGGLLTVDGDEVALTSGTDFVLGTVSFVGGTGSAATVGMQKFDLTAVATNGDVVGRYYKNGKIVLAVASNKEAAPGTEEVININLKTFSSAADVEGDVTVTLADGDFNGQTGLGVTGSSVKVSTLTKMATVVKANNTTLTDFTVLAGSSVAQSGIGFSVAGVKGISPVGNNIGPGNGNAIQIALDSGAKFYPTIAKDDFTTDNTSIASIAGAGTSVLTLTLVDGTNAPAAATGNAVFYEASSISLANAKAKVDTSGVAAGATVKATVSGTGAFTTYAPISGTYSLASAVASGVTVAYSDVDEDGKKATLYIGRTGQSVADGVKVTESAAGVIAANSLFTVSLGNGAKFSAGTPFSVKSSGLGTVTAADLAAAAGSAGGATSTATSGTPGNLTIKGLALDLTEATVGDLTVSVAGAGMTGSGAVATLKAATNTSATGTMPVVTVSGSAVALPDVVITEADKGALAKNVIVLQLPSGVSFDKTAVPTVTVKDAAGNTKSAFVTTPAAAHFNDSGRDYKVELAAGWTSEAAYTITVSGLKAKASTSAVVGDLSLTVGGSDVAVGGAADAKPSSNDGAKAYKQSIKVATIAAIDQPLYPVVTIADTSKPAIEGVKFTAPANLIGKPGAVYVAFILDGQVLFNNGQADGKGWATVPTGGKAPAYYSGTLGEVTLDLLKSGVVPSLAPFKGGMFVIGYGRGIAGLGDPFSDMLINATYNPVYTVK